jgi:hypothetical protein
MKLKLSFCICILLIVLATMAVAGTTPTPCIVGGVSLCPSGSICTQTTTCGGLCQSIFTPTISPSPQLPTQRCVAGPTWVAEGCSVGSTCSTTETCFDEGFRGCGGLCISTTTPAPSPTPLSTCFVGPYWDDRNCSAGYSCAVTDCHTEGFRGCTGLCIATTTTPPPLSACVEGPVGPRGCSAGSTCAVSNCHTEGFRDCTGLCIATQPSSVPCILGGPSVCGVNSVCTQTEVCSGQCIATFVPTPTPTPTPIHSTRTHRSHHEVDDG